MKFENRHRGPSDFTHLRLAFTQMSQMSVSVIGNTADILRTDSSYKQIHTLRYFI